MRVFGPLPVLIQIGIINSLTEVTWSSSDPTVATIDAIGLATGFSPGTSTITTTSGTISNSTTLTVAATDSTPPVIVPTVTPPVVAVSGVANGATYTLGCAPVASFTATDALSGVATSNGSLTGGNANGVGAFTYTANATDVAGNSTTQKANYSVTYNFIGFIQPINNDGSSIFRLGSTIPIKYQLTDCNGVTITTSVGTLAVFKITDAMLGTTEQMTVDSSGSANTDNLFRYSAPNYIYNLDTKAYTVGTYQLQAILDDGTVHTVNISLKTR